MSGNRVIRPEHKMVLESNEPIDVNLAQLALSGGTCDCYFSSTLPHVILRLSHTLTSGHLCRRAI